VPSPAISVDQVCKSFCRHAGFLQWQCQRTWALKTVSLSIERGEIYGLLGPNGSGKSTLIRILSTLLLADSGKVEVLGFSLPSKQKEVSKRIGRVGTDAAFYKKLSARENIVFTALVYGLDVADAVEKVFDILSRLGQEPKHFDEPLEVMSRGMQQKLSIARALMIAPPVLLLDEPTAGLDPESRDEVHSFLRELREIDNTTILLVTHDIGEAEVLCDRIGILKQGVLINEGTPERLIDSLGVGSLREVFPHYLRDKIKHSE
jgi:ABC-2 type transport system ATP-binding protein